MVVLRVVKTPQTMGRGAVRPPPLALVFCPLLKKSLGNTYLKILDHLKIFVPVTHMKKERKLSPRTLFIHNTFYIKKKKYTSQGPRGPKI